MYQTHQTRSFSSRGRGRRSETQYDSENMEKISVPTDSIGRVIGRGGSKVAELQNECNIKINVSKEINDAGERDVKLIGGEEGINKAKMMIEELINTDYSQNQRPSRGGFQNSNRNSFQSSNRNNFENSNRKDFQNQRPNQSRRQNNPEDFFNFVPVNQVQETNEDKPLEIDWEQMRKESEIAEAKKLAAMPKIIKNFYEELPEVRDMSPEEVEKFRLENNNICTSRFFEDGSVDKKTVPNPVTNFYQAFHNYPEILEEIRKVGFEKPSPIQAQAWPVLLSGEDMIGIAQTGTGKTLAFLLPALIHINGQTIPREERVGPSVIILAPTRELAIQIEMEVNKYYYKGIKSVCVYGGVSRQEQIANIERGVDIVIATPGRLNDIVDAGFLNVEGVSYAVLDEADRMLDLGFEPQIRRVMYQVRKDRQTCMTSATWPSGVRRLAQSYMVNPVQVYVGTLELAAVHSVTQTIIMAPDDIAEKYKMFLDFCRTMQPTDKVIAFCGKKTTADYIAAELAMQHVEYQIIHGSIEQCDREQAIKDIRDGTVRILIATDVASRGIDIDNVTHVINIDFPRNIEEYVHRVGRTGRAGKTGDSISYFARGDWANAKELINILEEAGQHVPEDLIQMSERYEHWKKKRESEGGRGGGRFRQSRW